MKNNRAQRRFDPDRRERILASALDVIAEHGIAETSLRRVAAAADVPLGSMTYHFADREAFLCEAMSRFADEMYSYLEKKMEICQTREDAINAVISHMSGEEWATRRNLLLCYELYAFSGRGGDSGKILPRWLNKVRNELLRFFDKITADALDALLEGYSIHRSVDDDPPTREDIEKIVKKLTD
ncbi:hypothetical protein WM46_15375 [Citrobacter freundii complex sp. CFNIH2]|uniref:TetR/AcrR family transcriptional regulator n=1 Tax=Citrobacter freundii complex sp. CFNIH2 TaxID=2066049 RepID=UPI000C86A14C|nr:TetR family transcriptional regulator [Citrobacter freundii complex sp. CFNIH2]AUO66022.1 hypothetical protein WM46_15375 [Citrobacter freundii complex sp. CFNIH2]